MFQYLIYSASSPHLAYQSINPSLSLLRSILFARVPLKRIHNIPGSYLCYEYSSRRIGRDALRETLSSSLIMTYWICLIYNI